MRRLLLALIVVLWPAVASGQATFLQTADDAADLTTYTFAAQNLGAAAADRYITVVSAARRFSTTTCDTPTMTIGGVTAVLSVFRENSITNCNVMAIHRALVPTGTTGTIVVTYPAQYNACEISVYRSVGTQTAGSAGGGVQDDPTYTLVTVPATGYVIGGAMTTSSGATATWTGLPEIFDAPMAASTTTSTTGALLLTTSAQSNLVVTVDWTATTESVMVAAAFGVTASGGTTRVPSLTLTGVGNEP